MDEEDGESDGQINNLNLLLKLTKGKNNKLILL